MFKKLISSDNAVKFIFDHYKNFAIAAVILAIGVSVLVEEREQGFWEVMRILSGSCIVVIGAILVIINERHGIRKLDEAGLNPFVHLGVIALYSLSMVAIVSRLILHNIG